MYKKIIEILLASPFIFLNSCSQIPLIAQEVMEVDKAVIEYEKNVDHDSNMNMDMHLNMKKNKEKEVKMAPKESL